MRLFYLPLFTSIWFLIFFIPQYAFKYQWEGKGEVMNVFTFSQIAIEEVVGTISVFGSYLGLAGAIGFLVKYLWLETVFQRHGSKAFKAVEYYSFLTVNIIGALMLWLLSCFFVDGFKTLHSVASSIYFVCELASDIWVSVVDIKYSGLPKAVHIVRFGLGGVVAICCLVLLVVLLVVEASNPTMPTPVFEEPETAKGDTLFPNTFGCVEVIVVLLVAVFYLTYVPFFRSIHVGFNVRRDILKDYQEPSELEADVKESVN